MTPSADPRFTVCSKCGMVGGMSDLEQILYALGLYASLFGALYFGGLAIMLMRGDGAAYERNRLFLKSARPDTESRRVAFCRKTNKWVQPSGLSFRQVSEVFWRPRD